MNRFCAAALLAFGFAALPLCHVALAEDGVMSGTPPLRDTQVTFGNYREQPFNQWAFRNAAAPLNVVMIPREGETATFTRSIVPEIAAETGVDLHGRKLPFDDLFEQNFADGIVVITGDEIRHEAYFGGFGQHSQHIWFSMTKSLVSAVFGLLVEADRVDLQASPAAYIPELKGSGFERVSIQQVLDHATAIDFKENYTDTSSDFFQHYAPALNMAWLPGAADAQPGNTDIYGIHDFLVKFIKPDPAVEPGAAFDYNSSNADVLGWLIARISGEPLQDFIQRTVWAKLGAEHDAYIAVDRAYMPVATGGMNTTLRDAARFGVMIRDQGRFNGEQVIPASWVDAILDIDDGLRGTMATNAKYSADPWVAYHNMWWLLDEKSGEFCAVGIHGQVIYINQQADTVMAWFSSQPTASAAGNKDFHSKLTAARALAKKLAAP